MSNKYQELGFNNREEYLTNLAEEFGLDEDTVISLAEMLGESEDFDGLPSSLEDMG